MLFLIYYSITAHRSKYIHIFVLFANILVLFVVYITMRFVCGLSEWSEM